MRAVPLGLGACVFSVATALWGLSVQSRGFPHEEHEGLFPLCASCHSGIEEGREATSYPSPDVCSRCHDGQRADIVEWSGPVRTASNLSYAHSDHAVDVRAAGDSADCRLCHGVAGSEERMAVTRAAAETCMDCHAHEADEHLTSGRPCLQCHVPLAEASGLSLDRIAGLDTPRSHGEPDFLRDHEPRTATSMEACATCHARESCTRCHLNGDALPSVASLASDGRVATVVAAKPPEYPEPETHRDLEWSWSHGVAAADEASGCANCHARDSCASCHEATGTQAIATLPTPAQEDPRGVRLSGDPRVHDVGFELGHGAMATANSAACATCHTTSFCEACHDGPDTPAFHFGDFLQMHGPEAWGAEAECASCHDPDVFCRGCHLAVGRGSEGRLDVAYHSGRPFWLFGHGGPARQGLESCRTCHSQADCAQCHAAVGAWRVNPHGPGFEAERLADANPASCLICHRTGIPSR